MSEILNIDKSKTALVVIDLQKGIVAFESHPYEANQVVNNAAALAEAFRKNKMPVFLVRVTPSEDMKDALKPITDSNVQWGGDRKPDWNQIVSELGPKENDFVITKKQWGAFYGTDLDLQLRRRKIDTIVLCGIATNFGVESTARFAYEYGYQQIFVEDAKSGRSEAEHENTLKFIFSRIGRIRKTKSILEEIK
ncbi:MAG TPA: hydrolase [Ignavibacteriaceae bacterium]|nr:hydrolase [Ignavibacteriaceae bacterium]